MNIQFCVNRHKIGFWTALAIIISLSIQSIQVSANWYNIEHRWHEATFCRGGSSKGFKTKSDPYHLLARSIRNSFVDYSAETSDVAKALKLLAGSQAALKGLDGAAHEAYQMTRKSDEVDVTVSGRASRSAARAGATADGLGACELCALAQYPELFEIESPTGSLAHRQVLLNFTNSSVQLGETDLSVLVLYEPGYNGGGGVFHGGIEDPRRLERPVEGQLLVVITFPFVDDLSQSLAILDEDPLRLKLNAGLVTNEVASVQPSLFKAAGSLIEVLDPILRAHNSSAIHFVGRSLAGGISNLAATILEGSLPLKKEKKKRSRKRARTSTTSLATEGNETAPIIAPLMGLGKGRTSSFSLGPPPCMSANIESDFVTSVIYGDDIICRSSKESLDSLRGRCLKILKRGWMPNAMKMVTDTASLTMEGIKRHAHGSEGEELRLVVPGRSYLLRPRRLEGRCSMHEVGGKVKGGREALRAAVLWQLDDILLSKSFWKHHQLDSYITGLDTVILRGVNVDDVDEE